MRSVIVFLFAALSFGQIFHDAVVPAGAVDGKNAVFLLPAAPFPTRSLMLVRNGVVQKIGNDFVLSGARVTFTSKSVPQIDDLLQSWFRTKPGTPSTAVFIDAEAPTGALNGINRTFVLTNDPNPALSLVLTRNGLVLRQGADYVLERGRVVVFAPLSITIPQSGDSLQAWYRTIAPPPQNGTTGGRRP